MNRILVVDDESLMREFLTESLQAQGYEVDAAESGAVAITCIEADTYDLVLTDYKMPKVTGMDVLSQAISLQPDCKVIMMTAYGTVENAVEAMKVGAFDYITKPFSLDEITILVGRALEVKTLEAENRRLHSELEDVLGIRSMIGNAPIIRRIYETIATVSHSRSTVLVTGESGTGKEVVARAVHYSSPRADRAFVKINCAALPTELMESELFGHEKGAFTGAVKKYAGRFERADGGTLLLDEISEMSPQLQAKLLRVLQEREFEPVGSSRTISVDVRIIATTNRDLQKEVAEGNFREDLFYRLNVIEIPIPPLRDRVEDVPALVRSFIARYNEENTKEIESVGDDALELLMRYDWPGKVRELENYVGRAVVVGRGPILTAGDFPGKLISGPSERQRDAGLQVGTTVHEMERRLIMKTLKAYGGNRTEAATQLGISTRTLRNKLHEYGEMGAFKDNGGLPEVEAVASEGS